MHPLCIIWYGTSTANVGVGQCVRLATYYYTNGSPVTVFFALYYFRRLFPRRLRQQFSLLRFKFHGINLTSLPLLNETCLLHDHLIVLIVLYTSQYFPKMPPRLFSTRLRQSHQFYLLKAKSQSWPEKRCVRAYVLGTIFMFEG